MRMIDGRVPADERLRLVNAHGADEAARIIADAEAAAAPPPEPAKGKTKSAPISDEE